jgi:hypothetical protein
MFIDPNNINHYKYLSMFEKVAAMFEDKIKFGWLDGTESTNRKRKRALGLVTEKLPGVAFNLLDARTVPFDEATELSKENLISFVHDFLDHKLESRNNPAVHTVDPEFESLYKDTPKLQFADFKDRVLSEGYDVLVLFYSSFKDEKSSQIAPHYNKLSKRFQELEFPNIRVYRMDISQESVPKHIRIDHIPSVYFFPAFKKTPPYVEYTGEAKILPMMFFVEKFADIPITLPELPHLHPSQIPDYHKQVEELDEEKRRRVKEANERRHWEF